MRRGGVHRALSPDGTQIGGTVRGAGPALVMVPGAAVGGEFNFEQLVPHLVDDFTCHTMSPRGRGLSADHPDQSAERLIEDVCAYVESVDGDVSLFGHSLGGWLAMEAAARCDDVTALSVYEPASFEGLGEAQVAELIEKVGEIQRATEAGDHLSACRTFYSAVAMVNEDDIAALDDAGGLARAATSMPLFLRMAAGGPPVLSDPGIPARIGAPTLVLRGTGTTPFYREKAADTARRIPGARLTEISGAGHLGPQLLPEPVAGEIRAFLAG